MQKKEFSVEIGGKNLVAVFSDLAEKANGSVLLRYGNTSVLATAVISDHKREGIDFFPLVVDYEEKFYAAGEILGSRFMRREGRPSDEAILGGRMVDRTIRPLFNHAERREVQVIITILSIGDDDPDVVAINAASLALATSNIPWNGPVSAVRAGKIAEKSEFVVNPTYAEREQAELDLVSCGKDGNINMIEAGACEASEAEMEDALVKATEEIERIQEFQKKIIAEIGKEKLSSEDGGVSSALKKLFAERFETRIEEAVFNSDHRAHIDLKIEWDTLVKELLSDEDAEPGGEYFEEKIDEVLHRGALENDRRADGRKMDEIRPLYVQAGDVSPLLHGTGIFYRGGTHVLSVLTFGGPRDAQTIEGMEIQTKKRFMHHYNFPPFSSGETGRVGGMNRRMIGHGALAEKALVPIIPSEKEFPYTIRIVSEVLSSNGSTSMGSVCASTLALMDAGVPIKKPAAGIAMGLMLSQPTTNNKKPSNYKILTDIQGPEDHHGDMDFKVAGTRDGITAVQMDVKVDSIPVSILVEAFAKAQKARLFILDTIEKHIAAPRAELSKAAPKIITMHVAVDKIGSLIGPSGKTINKIISETGAEIDIEEDGTVLIIGKNGSAEKAQEKVEEITHEFQPGERYHGEVTRLMDFGAFVRITPHAEGLVHISEFAPVHVDRPGDAVKIGDTVPVVVKEVDERGRLNLSIKQADQDFFKGKIKNSEPLGERRDMSRGKFGNRPSRQSTGNAERRHRTFKNRA